MHSGKVLSGEEPGSGCLAAQRPRPGADRRLDMCQGVWDRSPRSADGLMRVSADGMKEAAQQGGCESAKKP